LGETGRLSEALPLFGQSFEQMTALAERNPTEPQYVFDLCRLRINRGKALATEGRFRDAEPDTAQARDDLQRLVRGHPREPLVRDYPHVVDCRHGLALSLEALGEFLDYEGFPEGMLRLDEALEVKKQLAAEQPDNPDWTASIGLSCMMRAVAHRRRSKWTDAS